LTAGQVSDHVGAKILHKRLPQTQDVVMIADKGYDSDEYRKALKAKGITPCIPSRKGPPKGDVRPHSSVKQHINNDIRSKMCSQGSRIGAELQSVMTDARTPLSLLSSSRPSSHTGCNES
ncbi:MAG: transposase, partial [Hyphomonadaceae bacterium]|nr:transposase [Hyphomonadaceae bacterium]